MNPSTTLRFTPQRGWLILSGFAIGIGLIVAWLPMWLSAVLLLVVICTGATILDPIAGLGIALVFATFKPFTDYILPQLPADIGQIAVVITLGVWLLRSTLRREIRLPRSPINMALGVFLVVMLMTIPGALSAGYGIKELVKWVELMLVMWLVIEITGSERLESVIGMLFTAATVQAVIGIWQFGIRGDGPVHFEILGNYYRAYGTFEQPNPYAGFLGLILPIAASVTVGEAVGVWQSTPRKPAEWIGVGGLAALSGLLFGGLIASWSRGAWLGLGAAIGVMALAWPKRLWLGIGAAAGAGIVALTLYQAGSIPASITARLADFASEITSFDARGVDITPANYAVIERLAYWQAAGEMARHHPWLGVGFNNYEPVYSGYALINWPQPLSHAHNIYLNFLAETGVIGLAAYIGLWITVVWQTWRASRLTDGRTRSICIGLLGTWTHLSVHQFFDKLYVANINLHLGAMLGILSIIILGINNLKYKE